MSFILQQFAQYGDIIKYVVGHFTLIMTEFYLSKLQNILPVTHK